MELVFDVIAIKNNTGYASDFKRNGLFKVDIKSGDCTFLRLFSNEDLLINRLHCYAKWLGNEVYFIPSAGDYISIFNTETCGLETIEVPKILTKNNDSYNLKLKFATVIDYNNYLWLIPATYPGILRLDIKTKELKLIDNWLPKDGYMFRRGVCIRGNKVYAASGNNNNVLIFDMDLEKGETIKVGLNNNGIMDMCEQGENFIMAPRITGSVVKWNPVKNTIDELNQYPKDFVPGKIVFQYIYEHGSQIVFVPAYASHGIKLKNDKLLIDDEIIWKSNCDTALTLVCENENKVYFREYSGNLTNRFFYVDKNENNLVSCNFKVVNSHERLTNLIRASMFNHKIITESSAFCLEEWIKSIV